MSSIRRTVGRRTMPTRRNFGGRRRQSAGNGVMEASNDAEQQLTRRVTYGNAGQRKTLNEQRRDLSTALRSTSSNAVARSAAKQRVAKRIAIPVLTQIAADGFIVVAETPKRGYVGSSKASRLKYCSNNFVPM